MKRHRSRWLGLAFVLLATASACGDGARFTVDKRVAFEVPVDGAKVELPLVLRWRAHGLPIVDPAEVSDGEMYFGVFVDRRPPKPGESLTSFVERECAAQGNGCATRSYFASRQIYLTASTSLRLDAIAPATTRRHDQKLHVATIVLMDHEHRRVGESAWQRTFRVRGLG